MTRRRITPLHDLTRILLLLVLWANLWGGFVAAHETPPSPGSTLCLLSVPTGDGDGDGEGAVKDGHCTLCQLPALGAGPALTAVPLPSDRIIPGGGAFGAGLVAAPQALHPSDRERLRAPPARS